MKQLNATSLIHLDTFCSFCRSFPNSETSQLVSNSCRYCLGLRRSLNIAICLDFLSISVSRCSYFLPSRGIIDRLLSKPYKEVCFRYPMKGKSRDLRSIHRKNKSNFYIQCLGYKFFRLLSQCLIHLFQN